MTSISYTHNATPKTITLPEDLFWDAEFEWTPVVQSREYTLTGSLIVEEAVKQAGREIVLAGDDSTSWIDKSTLDDLIASTHIPGLVMILALTSGQTFSVRWDLEKTPIVATKIFRTFPHDDSDQDFWWVRLAFFESA